MPPKKRDLAELSRKVQQHMEEERKSKPSGILAEIILGGQDGLVNVLGIVLGVASATSSGFFVLVAGLVATFAESISMSAVAYSSKRAQQDHYRRELEQEKWEIENLPEIEREEVRLIYLKKGLRGKRLKQAVEAITSNKQLWLSFMMSEELNLSPVEKGEPLRSAALVGFSAILGSLLPLIPFIFAPVGEAVGLSLALSTAALFAVGAYKAKITVGSWWKSGFEMALVGMAAAIAGWLAGSILGEYFGLKSGQFISA
ncbi:MAG: VIT1/CCC1 transporter family protein [Candidatus Micrarchaeota archaeon]|nr:VIT1/CCC1 transporter family protein [Candidatus Micrarchaeota archaeon]